MKEYFQMERRERNFSSKEFPSTYGLYVMQLMQLSTVQQVRDLITPPYKSEKWVSTYCTPLNDFSLAVFWKSNFARIFTTTL